MAMGPKMKADWTTLELTTEAFWKMARGTRFGSRALPAGREMELMTANPKAAKSSPVTDSGLRMLRKVRKSADERTGGRHHEQSFPIEPIGQGSTEQRNRDHRKEFHQAEQAQCGVGIRDGKEVIGQHGGDQGASEEHAEACEEEDPNRRQCQNL